jgi:hypothetical protein
MTALKQLHLDRANGKLYWSDREGVRVMRVNLDGSCIKTLVQTGQGENDRHDATRWRVGITVDPLRKQIYSTQKGGDNAGVGRVLLAGIDIPKGETAVNSMGPTRQCFSPPMEITGIAYAVI